MSGLTDARNTLFRLYEHYVGEPDSPKDVYGYWLFVFGFLGGAIAVVLYAGTYAMTGSDNLQVNRVAGVLGGLGLTLGLFGIVMMLPVRRRGLQAGAVGLLVALVGVGSFGVFYPNNIRVEQWGGSGPDFTIQVVATYAMGIGMIAIVTALIPIVTGRKGMFVEEEGATEDPPILTGDALEGAQFAVFRDENGDWVWNVLHLEALATSEGSAPNRPATEASIDDVRQEIGGAKLMEITTSAFRLYEDEVGDWTWLLMRDDGSVVAENAGSFDARDGAEESVSFLKDRGPDADVIDIEGAAFNYYEARDEWHWQLLDDERVTLAAGASGSKTQSAAETAARTFADRFEDARVLAVEHLAVELRERDDGWYWRFVDVADDVLAESTVSFERRGDAEGAAEALLDQLESAAVTVAGEPTFERYEHGEGWRWRLVDAGEQIVARAPELLESERDSEAQIDQFSSNVGEAEVIEIDGAEYEIYPGGELPPTEDGEPRTAWHWRLVTEDRDVVADSTEPHESPDAATEAIERVRSQASEADLIEFENAAFQVYEADSGEWRWRLIDEDGNVLADSGEEHTSRSDAAEAMMTLKEQAPDAELLEIDTAAFELFQNEEGRWGWRLIDEGGKLVAEDPNTHPTRGAAKAAMDRLTANLETDVRTMEEAIFQTYTAEDDWYWRFVLPSNVTVASGENAYPTRDELVESVERIRTAAANGERYTIGDVAVQLYGDDEWRFRLLERDRSRVAESADSYADRAEVVAAVDGIKRYAAEAPIFTIESSLIRLFESDGWQWELLERDREVLGVSIEASGSRDAALEEIDRLRRLTTAAGRVDFDVASYELYTEDDAWRWRLIDESGATVAAGTERYETDDAARAALHDVRDLIAGASILEIEGASFELHADDEDDGWIWRLVDEHGRPMAESTQVYETRTDAREAMNAVKAHAPDGWITFTE